MKKTIIGAVIIIILIILGVFFFVKSPSETVDLTDKDEMVDENSQQETELQRKEREEREAQMADKTKTVIGSSVENRDIVAYHYGNLSSDKELLFIGGIHGGYSWNTVLVARELMNYLEDNSDSVPDNLKVTVIPVLNPDGLNKVVGTDGDFSSSDVPSSENATVAGRFNANDVDLNRNFDCDWQSNAVWQNKPVDGGNSAFSEPESQAIKNYVETKNPEAIVTWYSAAGGVFASNCHGSVSSETKALTNAYAKASGYSAYEEFDFYEITGDMVNWFAKSDIPAISVLLTNHKDVEWSKNQKGIEALFKYYAE